MKRLLVFLIICFSIKANAQVDFKQLLDGINWRGTEIELVAKYQDYIEKTAHEEWADEESCSDYTFKNVILGEFLINQAPIRVNVKSQYLYRVNFIVYEDSKDASLSKSVDQQLIDLYGIPVATEDDEGLGIISTYHKEWITNNYKMRSNLFVFGGDTYLYTISVEPIDYYPVDYTKAEVSINHYALSVPKIVSFKIDNDGNVYIMKEGGIEVKKTTTESYETTKGKVFVFEDGLVCYGKEDNVVIYMKDGFAANYPIKSK